MKFLGAGTWTAASRLFAPNPMAARHCTTTTIGSARASYSKLGFCLQASSFSGDSSSATAASSESSSFLTRREPLGKIFNTERDYLFTTQTNIRDFEWSNKEAEDLFESLLSLLDDDSPDPLELNTITLMKRPPERGRNLGKTSGVYNVHDGQQRLVSLSLFLAALRDNFAVWQDQNDDDDDGQAIRPIDIANMIYPIKRGKDAVARVELRKKNGKYLKCILSKKNMEGKPVADIIQDILPKKTARKDFPQADRKIFEVYTYFYERIQDLGREKATDLLTCFEEDAYLVIQVPSDSRTARNMVMGQGKGKNMEPVDVFKGMVCFNSVDGEQEQDILLDRWNELCMEVDRTVVQNACILSAIGWRGKQMRKNDEVDYMENFLKEYISKNKHGVSGETFFDDIVLPASRALRKFQDGHTNLVGKNEKERPSLFFLEAASRMAVAKDIKIVVLHFLVLHEQTDDYSQKIEIEKTLRKLEGIALWMLITKPKPKDRLEKCIQIIKSHHSSSSSDDHDQSLALSLDQKQEILQYLDVNEFGQKNMEKSKAKAILWRINEYIHLTEHQQLQTLRPIDSNKLHIEHILPQKHDNVASWMEMWGDDSRGDAEKWLHRLGNLVLLNEKVNAKIGNKSFEHKREFLGRFPYALTNRVKTEKYWNVDAVKRQHKDILDRAVLVWNLKTDDGTKLFMKKYYVATKL